MWNIFGGKTTVHKCAVCKIFFQNKNKSYNITVYSLLIIQFKILTHVHIFGIVLKKIINEYFYTKKLHLVQSNKTLFNSYLISK